MSRVETNRTEVVSRLEASGWVSEGGTKHEKFGHPDHQYKIMVPRHRVITVGVARQIAKSAGWI